MRREGRRKVGLHTETHTTSESEDLAAYRHTKAQLQNGLDRLVVGQNPEGLMGSAATILPVELIEAYRRTEFRVLGSHQFTLRVGLISQSLRRLFETEDVRSAAFLTAWNPYSAPASTEHNHDAQTGLMRRLMREGYPTVDGFGIDLTSDWEGEDSVLVLGMSLEKAQDLGRELNQNAIVACPNLVVRFQS